MAEITQNDHIIGDLPHSSWAISLVELKFRVLQRDQPGVLLRGADVFAATTPGTQGWAWQ